MIIKRDLGKIPGYDKLIHRILTEFCEYVVADERRIKQLKYDFKPLVLSYMIEEGIME